MDPNARFPNSRPFMSGTQSDPVANSQGQQDQTESLMDEGTDAGRKVYDQAARHLREGWGRLPELDGYVTRPVQANPLMTIALAGAVGYALGYLFHGRDSHWGRSAVRGRRWLRGHDTGKTTLQRNAEKALRMKREAGPDARIPEHQTAHEGGVRGSQVNYSDTAIGKEPTYTPNLKRSRVARSGDA